MPEILWKMLENPDPPALHAKEIYEDRKLVEVSNVKESVPVEAEAGLTHVPQLLKVIHAYQHDVTNGNTTLDVEGAARRIKNPGKATGRRREAMPDNLPESVMCKENTRDRRNCSGIVLST